MPSYIVCYDLLKSGQDYANLTKKLEQYGTYWHAQGSVWIIHTSQSVVEVRDNLMSSIDSNDKLIVAKLSGEAAWKGYAQNITDWLKTTLNKP